VPGRSGREPAGPSVLERMQQWGRDSVLLRPGEIGHIDRRHQQPVPHREPASNISSSAHVHGHQPIPGCWIERRCPRETSRVRFHVLPGGQRFHV
jgi:hypothetical protein